MPKVQDTTQPKMREAEEEQEEEEETAAAQQASLVLSTKNNHHHYTPCAKQFKGAKKLRILSITTASATTTQAFTAKHPKKFHYLYTKL